MDFWGDPLDPGYAAISGSGAFVAHRSLEGVGTNPLGCDDAQVDGYSLVTTLGSATNYALAQVCDGTTRTVNVDGSTFSPGPALRADWGLADARDGLYLLRNEPTDVELERGYVLETDLGLGQHYNVMLDAQGAEHVSLVSEHFAGAAISPNGEWIAYALLTGGTMQVFRIRTRTPG